MLIELEPFKPTFSRCWVTGGFDEFIEAVKAYGVSHSGTGHSLSVDDSNTNGKDTDGIRRVWVYCTCGHKRLILGPPDADDSMEPIFPPLPRVH